MTLIDRFVSGLELRDTSRIDPRPLDFGVSNERGTLLMLANWWTTSWGMGVGLLHIPATLSPSSLTFDGLDASVVRVGPPTDGFFADMLRTARYRTDVDRGRYYRELQKLAEFEPAFDFMPWIAEILSRPTIDPRAAMYARQTARREVGIIRLRSDSDAIVDVLVIDARGQVATFQDGGWLALFADQWAGYADGSRPDIASFLGWLAQQRPYGPFSLDEPRVTSAEGEIDAFVRQALNLNSPT